MPRRIRPPSAKRLFRFVGRSPNDVRDDVQEEFAFHLEMRVDDLVSQGLTEAEARAQALREFGNQAAGADACVREGATVERQRTVARLADELWQDASFGARLLRHSPGFATVAILTLAVAIGGNTAIFSVVNALALKPLPVRAPEEVVRIYTGESRTSWLNYQDIARQSTVFTDVAAHTGTTRALTLDDTTASMTGESTTSNYFTMLGVPAVLGRAYFPSDARADVIVLAERTWRTRFGSDPSVVGRTILVAGRSFEVIGVMPRGFRGARAPGFVSEFWVPIDPAQARRMLEDRGRNTFEIVARLRPGVSAEQAQAATLVAGARLAAEYPDTASRLGSSEVFRIDGIAAFRGLTRTLAPLFAFVGLMTVVAGLVLLVGCANIAGLLLGRGAARRREIGVRLALGAGRGRLIRQLLTESLLLALAGGVVGGRPRPLARGLDQPPRQPAARSDRIRSHPRPPHVRLHAGAVPPHRRALRPRPSPQRDPHECRPGAQTSVGEHDTRPERQRMRHWLVVGQVALSCALLLWAGLFARSLSNAHQVDLGFDPAGVVLAHLQFDDEVTRSGAIVPPAGGTADIASARSPAFRAQGLAKIVPLAFRGREEMPMRTETDPLDQRGRTVLVNRVSPEWFQTLRIPLLAGRDFTWRGRCRGATRRDRQRDAGAAILEWERARQTARRG